MHLKTEMCIKFGNFFYSTAEALENYAPSEHNAQISFLWLVSLAGVGVSTLNPNELGGGRTSPKVSPSQFSWNHATGGARSPFTAVGSLYRR